MGSLPVGVLSGTEEEEPPLREMLVDVCCKDEAVAACP